MRPVRRSAFVVVLVVLVVVSVLAGTAAAALAAAPAPLARVEVTHDAGDAITLDFTLDVAPGPASGALPGADVVIDDAPWRLPAIPGEPIEQIAGAPAVPFVVRSLIVPDDMDMEAVVTSATCHDEPARIAPSKGVLPRTVDPATVPFVFGPAYGKDEFFPAALASLGTPYVLRDHRGAALRINPLRYNPVRGTLRVCDRIGVTLRAVRPAAVNALAPGRAPKPSAAFETIYRRVFVNYDARSSNASRTAPNFDEQGELLVIAHDAFIPNLQPLASHKTGIGIPTTIVGVSTIGNDATSIRNYIQNYYNSHDLAFVLLVGDAAQVATPHASGGASDPSYSKLAGSDDYPDILVGRFSASTAAHVDTQVERTVDYETLPATGEAWYLRGVGIASAEGGGGQGDDGESDREHEDNVRAQLLAAGWTSVDRIYDPGATAQQVTDAVNAGRGIINYTGHGSATSWGTTGFDVGDVNALVNRDQLPFVVSVACVNGEFEGNDTCFAESWLRASKDGRPTGAVAFYGSSINQSWNSPMQAQDEFNRMLADETEPWHTYGGLCFASSVSMMDAYGGDGINMFNTWHIFGDPSLRIVGAAAQTGGLRVSPPEGFATAGPLAGPFTPASMTYTLENLDDAPLDFTVAAGASWLRATPAAGTIGARGSVTVTIAAADDAADADLGTHTSTIQFVNTTAHRGDTTRPASLDVRMSAPLHAWNCDGDPGWSRQGEWQFGSPLGLGGGPSAGYPDPATGCTGSRVFGTNLAGNVSTAIGGPYWLTMGPVDLAGVSSVRLQFDRWLNLAGPPFCTALVQVSNDGTNWTTAWQATGTLAENAWSRQSLDVSAVADGQPTVWFRWGYGVSRRLAVVGSGWNIDDVAVVGRLASARTTLSVLRDALAWTPIAGASGYDVVSGDLAALVVSAGDFASSTSACLADDTPATTFGHTAVPAPGAGTWFLVRGTLLSGALTYQELAPSQTGTRDAEIAASGHACP